MVNTWFNSGGVHMEAHHHDDHVNDMEDLRRQVQQLSECLARCETRGLDDTLDLEDLNHFYFCAHEGELGEGSL